MDTIIKPPSLKIGDRVLLISPSSKIDKKLIKQMMYRLRKWGLKPIRGKHATAKSGLYAGTVKERLADIQYGLDSPKIKALFCSRGGYGAIQLIKHLDFSKATKTPKWVVGYSDITAIHNVLFKNRIMALHAPMARLFAMAPTEDLSLEFTRKTLFGESIEYIIPSNKFNNRGEAKGVLIGGNLTVFQSIINTPFTTIPPKTILFFEDTNISALQVERLLFSILNSNFSGNIKGFIFGKFQCDFSILGDLTKINQSIHKLIQHIKVPTIFNFPIGHGKENYPLIHGAEVEMIVNKGVSILKF